MSCHFKRYANNLQIVVQWQSKWLSFMLLSKIRPRLLTVSLLFIQRGDSDLMDRLVHALNLNFLSVLILFQCVVCCQARSVMQVAPCGHQCQCRLCFVQNIQDAVANRDLPLRCLICNAKILRVKNNSKYGSGQDHPVHNGLTPGAPKFPKSVSGYSLQQNNGMHHSASNYSMSSG